MTTRHYNVWRIPDKHWTTAKGIPTCDPNLAQERTAPKQLTLAQAREFLPKAAASFGNNETHYEVRRIDPNNQHNGLELTDEDVAPRNATMQSTLQSFRLGNTVYVYLDGNELSDKPTDTTISATIIGKGNAYYVLGWKGDAFKPGTAPARRKSHSGVEYVANEDEFVYSCTAKLDLPCSMQRPIASRTSNAFKYAALGETIELYVDANDNVVPFETATTIQGRVIGKTADRVIVGWKDGEPKSTSASKRIPIPDITSYAEDEADHIWAEAFRLDWPCCTPVQAVAKKVMRTAMDEEMNKLKAEVAKLKEQVGALTPAKPAVQPSDEKPNAKKEPFALGDRVKYSGDDLHSHNGTYIGRVNNLLWILTDQETDKPACRWRQCGSGDSYWLEQTGKPIAELAASIGLKMTETGTNVVHAYSDQLTALDEPRVIAPAPFKEKIESLNELVIGDRVKYAGYSAKDKGLGTYIGEGFVLYDGDYDLPLLTWSLGQQVTRIATRLGLKLHNGYTNVAYAHYAQSWIRLNEPRVKLTAQVASEDAKPVLAEAKEEAPVEKEAPAEDKPSRTAEWAALAGITIAGAMVNELSKSTSKEPKEVIRVNEPAPMEDSVVETKQEQPQEVAQ